MARIRLKGWFTTYKRLKSGERVQYHYHRATGRRLNGLPGSAEFIADYAAAEKLMGDRHGGTFNGLVREFTLSDEFLKGKAASTQAEYKRMLTAAEKVFGTMPLAALDDPRVRVDFLNWRQKVARTSGDREADNRLSAISAMLTWRAERDPSRINYLRGFKRLYHGDRSEIVWLPEHIAAFMKIAPIEVQRALILALHTGARQGDILTLPWSAYDGQTISYRPGKNRKRGKLAPLVTVPCTAALRGMLDGMTRVSPLILTTKTGHSFKARYFGRVWEEATEAAELRAITLPGSAEPVALHFHDLRGTAVTLLSEAGCTPQQIATITGHSLKNVHKILERYLARTRGLAEQAIFNFENSPRTRFANQLQTVEISKHKKKGKLNAEQ